MSNKRLISKLFKKSHPPINQKFFNDTLDKFEKYIQNINIDQNVKSGYLDLVKKSKTIQINKPKLEDAEILLKLYLASVKTEYENPIKRLLAHLRKKTKK